MLEKNIVYDFLCDKENDKIQNVKIISNKQMLFYQEIKKLNKGLPSK